MKKFRIGHLDVAWYGVRRKPVEVDPLVLGIYLVGGVLYGSSMQVEFGTLGVLITAVLYTALVLWILRLGREEP